MKCFIALLNLLLLLLLLFVLHYAELHCLCNFVWHVSVILDLNNYIRSDGSAFLFSLKNHLGRSYKMRLYRNPQNAIYSNNGYGPTFGAHDIYISNNCHTNTNSYSNLGQAYLPPHGYGYGSAQARAVFAGSYKFRCDEYEVFYQAWAKTRPDQKDDVRVVSGSSVRMWTALNVSLHEVDVQIKLATNCCVCSSFSLIRASFFFFLV